MYYNQSFDKTFALKNSSNENFEDCEFLSCDFSKATFNSCNFNDCVFIGCNLSMAQLNESQLDHVRFIDCKLLGVDFSQCTDFLFSVDFKNCILNYVVFYQKNLSKTSFTGCSILQADFTACNLTEAVFDNSDLSASIFEKTDLRKADLSSAKNYIIDPERNLIKKAKFSMTGVLGLLHNYDIILE